MTPADTIGPVFVVGCPGSGSELLREHLAEQVERPASASGAPARVELLPGPASLRRLPALLAEFPCGRVVHVVRDGRDVALAQLDAADADGVADALPVGREPIAGCALWWRWLVLSGREGGARLGLGRYVEISYEALLADPAEQVRRIGSSVGVPLGGPPPEASGSPRADWRSRMSQRDLELFEALAGDLLDDLGLERAFHRISPAFVRIASEHAMWWREHLAQRTAEESTGGSATLALEGSDSAFGRW